MDNFKKQAKALVTIGEKVLLLVAGAAALALSVLDPRFETLKLAVQLVGALCVIFGLAPMVWAYIKATLPKLDK